MSFRSLFGGEAGVLRERNFQLLLLVAVVHPLGNGLLSPILDSLTGPLGASPANIGWMVSVFLAPAIVIIPLMGVLADRYDRKPVLVGSLVLFGTAGTAIAFTNDFRVALLLRLLQGVGWAGLVPIVVTSIGDLYAGPKEATAQGLRLAGTGFVGGLVSLFAGIVVVVSWRYPFLLYALALPVAVLVYFRFDGRTAADGARAGSSREGRPYRRELFTLVRRRRVIAIVVARFMPFVVFAGFTAYNSLIVVELLDGTPAQAGVLFAVLSLTLSVAASQAGRVTAAFDSRYLTLAGAHGCFGVGFATVVFAPGIVVAGAGIALVGFGIGIAGSLYRSIVTGFAPSHLRAGLVSTAAAGTRAAGALTPVAMGGIIALGTPTVGFASAVQLAGLAVVAVGAGGGIVCVLVASASPPVPAERPEAVSD